MATFIDDSVFGVTYDDTIKTAIRAAKGVEDACEMGSLKDGLDVIVRKRTEELTPNPEDTPAAAPSVAVPPAFVQPGMSPAEPMTNAVQQLHDEIVAKRGRPCTLDEIDMLKRFGLKAARNLWGNATLIKREASERAMVAAFNELLVVQTHGDGIDDFTGVFLDPKALYVSATHPGHRVPALDPDIVKMLLRSFMATRTPGSLHHGDLFFILDGAVSTNRAKLASCFVDETGDTIQKKEKCICLTLDEDSSPHIHS